MCFVVKKKINMSSFVCVKCGNCCAIRGRVQLRLDEIEAIANALNLDTYTFTERYTRLSSMRTDLELIDNPDGSCIMLTPDRLCRIHAVKPRQCHDFPHTWRTEDATNVCRGLV